MAIKWRPLRKRRCIQEVLDAHPVDSGRCAEAGELIHLLARTQDTSPQLWLLRPSPECGPLAILGKLRILPKIPKPPRWTHHVCVETQLHCVCALAGAAGTPSDQYIREHFQYPDDIVALKHPDAGALSRSISAIP